MNRPPLVFLLSSLFSLVTLSAAAQLPAPSKDLVDFPFSFAPDAPGAFAAEALLDKPAGRLGPVTVKGGHFYTGEKRIRFWGVNFAFSACFPTHDQADQVAVRLARFGVNAVRFHHMDMQKFPGGIFADEKLETLSPEALDRLDYLIAAFKKQGVYSNINLHVSRAYAKSHKWPNADKLTESYDKLIDLFHPDLIAAEKQYAKDLLAHVNKYTGQPYTSEPAVCMVEINNENTLFLWSGEAGLANLPEPYAGILQKLWNEWLVKKYTTQQSLAAVWNTGAEPRGPNLVRDPGLASLNQNGSPYTIEQHGTAKMALTRVPSDHIPLAQIKVSAVDGTSWHLQFSQAGLKLKKGQFYTLSFRARTDGPKQITASIGQAHEPWQNLGLATPVKLYPDDTDQYYGFVATADDDNARISFALGAEVGTIYLGHITLQTGGQTGLDALNESAAKGTVNRYRPGSSWTPARRADWYDFLQQTDEKYFVDFKNYLRDDLKLQAPVTGTIGLGPLGTLSQSKMDFVDAHAYWDHPQFPGRSWSATNWTIKNQPMIDNPASSPLWGLAATRVAGKPLTVTEYNHSAPNEWQAECIPLIATYAALQDWDAVFLFAYSHNNQFEKDHTGSFFDIEGNWPKMAAMPLAARIFTSESVPEASLSSSLRLDRTAILPNAGVSYHDMWKFATSAGLTWQVALTRRLECIDPSHVRFTIGPDEDRIHWTATTPGTGRFTLADRHAAIFVGFAAGPLPIPLGDIQIEKLETPFASLILIPADPTKSLADADRLLLCATARCENPGQQWNDKRTTLGNNWGKAPPRIEVVHATLHLPHDYTVRPLDGAGKPLKEFSTTARTLILGDSPTLWYELIRR
ncbi:MAG: hypothetical protein JWN40_4573 [Phycisphaerales bacterium]|nr:hypothetical protein [Phycisphaerales bacterium]